MEAPIVRQRLDPMYVPIKEKGWHYRWLADDPDRLSQHVVGENPGEGYSVLRGATFDEAKEIAAAHGLPETYVDPLTCRIRFGRLVLGRVPMAVIMARRAEKAAERKGTFSSVKETYIERARRAGVKPVFFEDIEELEDRKKFATRESDNRVALSS